MRMCSNCRSYAINVDPDGELCDACYLRRDIERLTTLIESVVTYCKEENEHCDPFCCGEYLIDIIERLTKGLKNE